MVVVAMVDLQLTEQREQLILVVVVEVEPEVVLMVLPAVQES